MTGIINVNVQILAKFAIIQSVCSQFLYQFHPTIHLYVQIIPCSNNSDLITMICYGSTAFVSCANVTIVIIYMGAKLNSRWIWYTNGIVCAMGPWNKMASLVNFVFFQLSENIPWVNWIREAVLLYNTMGIPRMLSEASVSNLMLWMFGVW